jgi:hypothetical protein
VEKAHISIADLPVEEWSHEMDSEAVPSRCPTRKCDASPYFAEFIDLTHVLSNLE